MDLSGIVLAVLIILVGLGVGAGVMIVLPERDGERNGLFPQSGRLETASIDSESPPPENAWKPETWYSEVADGTLFPNQPSPNFRVSADSSFQRAIARRDLEDRVSDEPTQPHASISRRGNSAPVPPRGDSTPLPLLPDDLEALTEIPTVAMHTVPIKDNLPPTLKQPAVRRSRSAGLPPENMLEREPKVLPPADYGDQMLQQKVANQSPSDTDASDTAE